MDLASILAIAEQLIAARASKQALTPADCSPSAINSRAESYAIQAAVWQSRQGTRRPGAWKIGNASDNPAPVRAAMPDIIENGRSISTADFRLLGIEAEIAVRFAHDLPPREQAWSREEVLDTVGSVHIAIEIVDTALQDYVAAGPLWRLADSMLHGSFVLGEALTDWRELPWHALTMQSLIDDRRCAEATGGHPHVDPFTLLPWWANEGSRDWGGVRVGDVVTTGTWNGMHFAYMPESFEARLADVGGAVLGSACVKFR